MSTKDLEILVLNIMSYPIAIVLIVIARVSKMLIVDYAVPFVRLMGIILIMTAIALPIAMFIGFTLGLSFVRPLAMLFDTPQSDDFLLHCPIQHNGGIMFYGLLGLDYL